MTKTEQVTKERKEVRKQTKSRIRMYFPKTLEYYHREYFPLYYRIYYIDSKK